VIKRVRTYYAYVIPTAGSTNNPSGFNILVQYTERFCSVGTCTYARPHERKSKRCAELPLRKVLHNFSNLPITSPPFSFLLPFVSTMIFPKFKHVLLLCVALPFPIAFAVPEDESVAQLDISSRSEDSHRRQIDFTTDFTTDVAAFGGEEEEPTAQEPGTSMGLLQGTPSILLDRKLRRAGQSRVAVVAAQNSSGVMEQTQLYSASLYNSNKSSSDEASPSAVTSFTTLSCACAGSSGLTQSRLCVGQQCSSYSSKTFFYNLYASAGVSYYFSCWCPSSSQLELRYVTGFITWNYGSKQKKCPGVYKTTKSAFSMNCKFTVE
jgi:hypothetical protein